METKPGIFGFWSRIVLWKKIFIMLIAGLIVGTLVGEDIATT